jgi:hypothetical protein
MAQNLRARAVAWWRRSHADPDKRDFRRIGLIAFGAVGASVILARLTQDTAAAGAVRALAITVFALAAIALLGVVILMGEEVVEEMDASDPMRARHGGAYGPRIKQFWRDARRGTRAWIASIPDTVRAMRREVTRESLSRFAHASVEALGGAPPPDVGPPPGAGRLARPLAEPPSTAETRAAARDDPTEPGRPIADPPARRRALTASELAERSTASARRRPASPRSARSSAQSGRSGARTGLRSRD